MKIAISFVIYNDASTKKGGVFMDPKTAESIGLLRHQIISPVLMETTKAQMDYFCRMAEKEFDVPGRGPRRYGASTMKGWLHQYRKKGFTALVPKCRKDKGKYRILESDTREKLRSARTDRLNMSCVQFYDVCLEEGMLGKPPIGLETLRRFLRLEGLYKKRESTPRKKFEMRYFGELWTCDFMHGPQVSAEGAKRKQKAILFAIIDDHSRMIVGAKWALGEDTRAIETVFKEAILSFGQPDRLYCDNGSAFSSHYLDRCCAKLGIGLVHSKPYDSPSRGKIERFFRTVRERFLSSQADISIEGLNQSFSRWLREKYHHHHHTGINTRPIDRYSDSVKKYPRRRVDAEILEDHFLVAVTRTVNKDATVSLRGEVFEVPPQYIGRKVELRFSQDNLSDVFLYDGDTRVCKIQLVDSQLNGKIYEPSPRISNVALHESSGGVR
ncbi:MAG: DDE-type integrase/transposase/recombinase [Bdellovibrionales bacterium]|nr:DDE-type integrase/transposase/recombinase [Bdellovibrionales bacterium]